MTTSTKSRKATTKVQAIVILATYIFKHLNRICFTVLSSDGVTKYNTCFENGRGSCTCEGNAVWHKECRHIKYLAPIATAKLAARNERAQAVKEAQRVIAKTAPRQFESYLSDVPHIATAQDAHYELIRQGAIAETVAQLLEDERVAHNYYAQQTARKWTITDPTDAWYGLSDEQIATAIATYEMATDSRF